MSNINDTAILAAATPGGSIGIITPSKIDAIVFLALDVAFLVVSVGVGYKGILKRLNQAQGTIKRIIVGLYMVMVAQVIVSAVMAIMVFRCAETTDQMHLQEFIRVYYGRSFDWLILSIQLVLVFKFLFSLKRVETQMNVEYLNVQEIIDALKSQIRRERCIMIIYIINVASCILFLV